MPQQLYSAYEGAEGGPRPGVMWSDELPLALRGVARLQAAFRGHSCRKRLRMIPSREVERAVRELMKNEKGCKRLFGFLLFMMVYFCATLLQTDVTMQNEVQLGMQQLVEGVAFDEGNRNLYDVTTLEEFWQWTRQLYLATYQGRYIESECNVCYQVRRFKEMKLNRTDAGFAYLVQPEDCKPCIADSSNATAGNGTAADYFMADAIITVYDNSTKVSYSYSCADACAQLMFCITPPCNGTTLPVLYPSSSRPVTYRNGDMPAAITANDDVCLGGAWSKYGITRNLADLNVFVPINASDGLGFAMGMNKVIGGMMIIWDVRQPKTCESPKIKDDDFYKPCWGTARTDRTLTFGASSSQYSPGSNQLNYTDAVEGYTVLLDLGLFNIGLGFGYCALVALEADKMLGNDTGTIRVVLSTFNGNKRTMYATSQVVFEFELGGQVKVTPEYNSFMVRGYLPPADKYDAWRISMEVIAVILAFQSCCHDCRKRRRRRIARWKSSKAAHKAAKAAMEARLNHDGGGGTARARAARCSILPQQKRQKKLWWYERRAEAVSSVGGPRKRYGMGPSCFFGCCYHFWMWISFCFWLAWAASSQVWTVPVQLTLDDDGKKNSPLLKSVASTMADIADRSQTVQAYRIIFLLASLLALIRLFHMMRFHRRLSLVSDTLRNSAMHLGHFLIVFLLVVLVYALAGWCTLGESLDSFSTLALSIFTMLRIALGENDELYPDIVDARTVTGLLTVITYQMLVGLLMFNVLIAIAIDAHRDYVDGLRSEETIYESLKAFLGVSFMRFLVGCRRRRQFLRADRRRGRGSGSWWRRQRKPPDLPFASSSAAADANPSGEPAAAPIAVLVPVGGISGAFAGTAASPGYSSAAPLYATTDAVPAAGLAAVVGQASQRTESSESTRPAMEVSPGTGVSAGLAVMGTDGKPVRMVRRVTPQKGSEMRLSPNCPKYLDCFAIRDLIAAGAPAPRFLANRRTRLIVHHWMFVSREMPPEDLHGNDNGGGVAPEGGAAGRRLSGGGGPALPSAAGRSLAAGRAAAQYSDTCAASIRIPSSGSGVADDKSSSFTTRLHAAASAVRGTRAFATGSASGAALAAGGPAAPTSNGTADRAGSAAAAGSAGSAGTPAAGMRSAAAAVSVARAWRPARPLRSVASLDAVDGERGREGVAAPTAAPPMPRRSASADAAATRAGRRRNSDF